MDELRMLISGVMVKDGKKKACIRFEDGTRFAEGFIPDCKITSKEGFSDDEIAELEKYMLDNLEALKGRAAGVDPIRSMMREE